MLFIHIIYTYNIQMYNGLGTHGINKYQHPRRSYNVVPGRLEPDGGAASLHEESALYDMM